MGKILGWTGAILFFGVLGSGLWMAWPILFPQSPSGWLSSLSKADAALIQNRMDLARKVLDKPEPNLSVTGWLQWEKRVQEICMKSADWSWAAKIAKQGQTAFPGNPDLTAYYVWTLLRTNVPSEALVYANRVLKGTRWDSLVTQAAVQAEGLATGDWSDLKSVMAQPSEKSFLYYNRMTTFDNEPALRKNALLSALYLGRLEDARTNLDVLTPTQRETPPFDRLEGLMAYDQGDWGRAAALLKNLSTGRPSNLLVLADVYLHLGDKDQARMIYDQLLADKIDPVPLALAVNRSTLAIEESDPGKALGLLQKVQGRETEAGGDKVRLLTLEARFLLGENDAVAAALDRSVQSGDESE